MSKRITFIILWLQLSACATTSPVPENIRTSPTASISILQAQKAPQTHQGKTVRWGGVIADVTNLASSTQIEIVSRRLSSNGRPLLNDSSLGRFVASIEGFVDPQVYAKGREITVYGTLDGTEAGKIGEYPYPFPKVQVNNHQLWQKRVYIDPDDYYYRYPPPWWDYDPWFHRGFYPFYHPYYRW